jgi:gliding motility-associated-like protein
VYPAPDGGYVTGETTTRTGDYGEHFRIIKTDSKGNTPGCIVNNFSADIQIQPVYTAAFKWDSVNDIIFDDPASPDLAITENRVEIISTVQRCSTSDCDSIKLNGSSSVCSLADTVTYSAGRNAPCVSSVLWQIDSTIANIITYTDTTIRLLFKRTGKVSLGASIFTACKVLQDSIAITINDSRKTLDLGPDIQLCNSSTVKLSAGSGFKTYHWNAGSADSTLTAYLPGKYYVTVSDYCYNNFSDTVIISTAPAIPLNLSANAPRCDQDSLLLTATPGFKSYSWSPDYHISSVSGNSIKVWPATDTTYTVVAVINEYCTVTDSTRVTVQKSVLISIGNDTTFCAGGAVKLHAPPGFAGYLWQDGSSGDNYVATQKGMYWLSALNANGCYSKDTMLVTDVYPLPFINLGRDGGLCLNINILHAGSGQKNYAWQDGSADSVFRVNEAGTYSVTVTSGDGCVNADTIHVTSMIAPSAFLVHDISLCENGAAQLTTTGSWVSYLWSTGATEPSVTIKQPGQYWLQVTDYNGCAGRDTVVVVLKTDCPKVVYFPNAFSPNHDGHNDIFRPFAGAPLEKYSLEIYNRWGQKIFTSNDPLAGWNGEYRDVPATTGAYIYLCRYKFYNEGESTIKGTVVVVR